MYKIKFNSEEEWLAARKNHIGASDTSIIMGVSKWKTNDGRIKTPRLLWEEKLGLTKLNCDNASTRYGKEMEEPARLVYQEMVGDLFKPICVKNEKYPYLMASLDGLNVTDDKAVEIKNANREDHEMARQGKVPEKYIPQVQMQALVTEFASIDYFSFHKGEGIIVTAKRDEEYIKILEKKLAEFWECITTLKEPALTDDDFIERDDIWKATAERLYEIKCKKRDLCKEEKTLEAMLKEISEGKSSRSGGYTYERCTSLGRVDYRAIPQLLNVDLNPFRGPSISTWRLRREKS